MLEGSKLQKPMALNQRSNLHSFFNLQNLPPLPPPPQAAAAPLVPLPQIPNYVPPQPSVEGPPEIEHEVSHQMSMGTGMK
jgi:hypothetical protein